MQFLMLSGDDTEQQLLWLITGRPTGRAILNTHPRPQWEMRRTLTAPVLTDRYNSTFISCPLSPSAFLLLLLFMERAWLTIHPFFLQTTINCDRWSGDGRHCARLSPDPMHARLERERGGRRSSVVTDVRLGRFLLRR